MSGAARPTAIRKFSNFSKIHHPLSVHSNDSFNPGGWLDEPVRSTVPLLDVRIRPRMNLYLETEARGSFIIDAGISYTNGDTYYNSSIDKASGQSHAFNTLYVDVSVVASGLALVSHKNVTVNTTSNELSFPLSRLEPRFDPYEIVLVAASGDGNQSFTATTDLYYLPSRTDGGSVAKLDSLYGGMLVQDYLTNSTEWTPLLPYSYYVSWDGWLELDINNLNVFADLGYNIIHIVPNAGLPNEAFNFTELSYFLDRCDELNLRVMFDLRWTYMNLTSVEYQVNQVMYHPSLLLWYTGDEPDGQTDPLNATKITYDLIKSMDAYHPVSLCLNCYNFYFEDYSSGADIILSDVYPISVNESWSTQYDTPCNTTYGCCGCDDCGIFADGFEDISLRLDNFASFTEWLGIAPKSYWGVPQAFGNETFWTRYPTADEEVVMNMLSINHNAKGIVMWDYPTEADIRDVTSKLSQILTKSSITKFLLGAPTHNLAVTSASDYRLDAAAWVVGSQALVSVVGMEYVSSTSNYSIALPAGVKATGVSETLWGSAWNVGSDGALWKNGLDALEFDFLVVDL